MRNLGQKFWTTTYHIWLHIKCNRSSTLSLVRAWDNSTVWNAFSWQTVRRIYWIFAFYRLLFWDNKALSDLLYNIWEKVWHSSPCSWDALLDSEILPSQGEIVSCLHWTVRLGFKWRYLVSEQLNFFFFFF